jgi:O-acetyl-ADP-ribose deacetylase (regulator of RNase III)
MIDYRKGNVLESKDDILVNTVNDVGCMGGGIARQFAEKYPDMEKDYIEQCNAGNYEGNFYKLENGQVIYNMITMPTKKLDGYPLIEQELIKLKNYMLVYNLKTCSMPWVGCGIAGLEKDKVKDIIEKVFADYKLTINVMEL